MVDTTTAEAPSDEVTRAETQEQLSRQAAVEALREHRQLHEKIAPSHLAWLLVGYTLAEAWKLKQVQVATACLSLGLMCFLARLFCCLARNATVALLICLLFASCVYLKREKMLASITRKKLFQRLELHVRAMTPQHAHGMTLALCNVPVVLELLGQFNMLWFIQQRSVLAIAVLVITAPVACVLSVRPSLFPDRWRGVHRRKKFKFVVQFVAICFWISWNQLRDPLDILRLLGPLAVNSAGITLATLPEKTISELLCVATRSTVVEVVTDVNGILTEDTGLMLVLFKWLSDYWQLPCEFDWNNMLISLRDEVSSLGCCFAKKVGQRISELDLDREAEPLVRSVQSYVAFVPPSRRTAVIMLVLRSCPTTLAAFLLLLVRFTVVLPAFGFIIMELSDLHQLSPVLRGALLAEESPKGQKQQPTQQSNDHAPVPPTVLEATDVEASAVFDSSMDGLDVLLVTSTELRGVWRKLRYAVRCLEHSLTAARVCQTGVKTVSLASRVTSIALVVKRMRDEGTLSPSVLQWLVQEQNALRQVCGILNSDAAAAAIEQSDVAGSIRDAGLIVANIMKLMELWQTRRQDVQEDPDAPEVDRALAATPNGYFAAASSWFSGAAARWLPAAKPESEMTEEERAAAREQEARRERWKQARRRMHGNA